MTDQPRHTSTVAGDEASSHDPATGRADAGEADADNDSAEKPAEPTDGSTTGSTSDGSTSDGSTSGRSRSPLRHLGRFARELVIIVAIALVASALLRAFVVQAFFVPSGSMLPEIQLDDRILVSRIGDIERGEIVVFEDPGGWIPSTEQAPPPGTLRKGMEFIGVLPASGHEHLVKRVIGLPGDHVVCCDNDGKLTINGYAVDETDFLKQPGRGAADTPFDVIVPKDGIFVLGDNRYVSGDSAKHVETGDPFIPTDLVTGRAFAVVWPASNAHVLRIPQAYEDVPGGQTPPDEGVIKRVTQGD